MFEASAQRILRELPDDAVVLDVGGGANPFPRADWVIDLLAWEDRGLYGERSSSERFGPDTWVRHDICSREPWPFADGYFDFAVCSHTLEDVRDPVWVCSELVRVARAGYIETPSRLEEQSVGVNGPWVGWSHHRWFVEAHGDALDFVFKHHVVCGRPSTQLPYELYASLTPEERVLRFWWTGRFTFRERLMSGADELDTWLEEFARRERETRGFGDPPPSRRRRGFRRRGG